MDRSFLNFVENTVVHERNGFWATAHKDSIIQADKRPGEEKNRMGSQEGKRDKLEGKGCPFEFSMTSLSPIMNRLPLYLMAPTSLKYFIAPGCNSMGLLTALLGIS